MRTLVCVIGLSIGIGGCAHPGSGRYDATDVGRSIETSRGEVVSSRIVDITGDSGLKGPLAGGVFGATTSGIAVSTGGRGGNDNNGLIVLLGALAGATIGYFAEQEFNNREGIEYILDVEDGRTITLVQNREGEELPLPDGTPVLIQVGPYSRVVPDPRGDAGEWVDPDTLPPDGSGTAGDWIDPNTRPPTASEVGAGRLPGGEFEIGTSESTGAAAQSN